MLLRLRSSAPDPRHPTKLVDLEVHWISAYVAAAGIAGWMLAERFAPSDSWFHAVSVGAATIGFLLIAVQGAGGVSWFALRVFRSDAAMVVVLLISVIFFWYGLIAFGIVDMALRTRRRVPPATPAP